ncbi:uncharacterized protein [Miscanthus floridulus]|uniref:uncharacterized protein n=1 Tax=Miscanthus floridulus TaxID=154761 RepID=UPI0034585CBB
MVLVSRAGHGPFFRGLTLMSCLTLFLPSWRGRVRASGEAVLSPCWPDEAESGLRGPGEAESGPRGSDKAESGPRGSDEAESGIRGPGEAESGPRGSDEAESGPGGSDEAESGPWGPGKAESGPRGSDEAESGPQEAESLCSCSIGNVVGAYQLYLIGYPSIRSPTSGFKGRARWVVQRGGWSGGRGGGQGEDDAGGAIALEVRGGQG